MLLVSDLHYTLPQLDWVLAATPSVDLVVLAGDLLDISSPVPLDAQAVVILRYLALLRAHTQVAVSSGNHDLTGPDAQGEQAALWLAGARHAGGRDYGDTELGGWIALHRPDIVLSGHVHEPPFKPADAWADRIGATWVFNAGRQIGPVPACIGIDLGTGAVGWSSLLGSENLRLEDARAPARSVF